MRVAVGISAGSNFEVSHIWCQSARKFEAGHSLEMQFYYYLLFFYVIHRFGRNFSFQSIQIIHTSCCMLLFPTLLEFIILDELSSLNEFNKHEPQH